MPCDYIVLRACLINPLLLSRWIASVFYSCCCCISLNNEWSCSLFPTCLFWWMPFQISLAPPIRIHLNFYLKLTSILLRNWHHDSLLYSNCTSEKWLWEVQVERIFFFFFFWVYEVLSSLHSPSELTIFLCFSLCIGTTWGEPLNGITGWWTPWKILILIVQRSSSSLVSFAVFIITFLFLLLNCCQGTYGKVFSVFLGLLLFNWMILQLSYFMLFSSVGWYWDWGVGRAPGVALALLWKTFLHTWSLCPKVNHGDRAFVLIFTSRDRDAERVIITRHLLKLGKIVISNSRNFSKYALVVKSFFCCRKDYSNYKITKTYSSRTLTDKTLSWNKNKISKKQECF